LGARRQKLLAASAQQAGARSRFSEAEHNLNRTRDLHRQDIVSTRRLQEQQAIRDADQANLAANSYQQQLIAANSRLTWGDTLTEWFTHPQHKVAAELLEHRAQLLQITLPAGSRLEPGVVRIQVDPAGQRQSALSAELVSAAPLADPVTLGQRYFFKCGQCRWPLGTHVTAWLPSGPAGEPGVDLPQSAVVWHTGQAWVFVKTDATHFSRRPLAAYSVNGGHYFVAEGLHPGEEIVTSGAQTLLSQMLKAQIPEEDND
ncbi:efflux RND transporter periplasmic adaptor subunit, partial [Methylomonas koyamae]|uniref:efflux RND transporter periplasmic adaptor subunit n=1 Tax=Methylomonas koyamae TaxID=702114 RepID=UPI001642BEB9